MLMFIRPDEILMKTPLMKIFHQTSKYPASLLYVLTSFQALTCGVVYVAEIKSGKVTFILEKK